ncbi:hypothetical protein HYALB_00005043 [Hymenoscyphus albidus]|uniref:Uncharacterized protein n=2 Tax=Hymenoscyphus TaxID=5182 RepID=A0A9N9PHD6_9HELO|nr:hypothetical protein HYFRA_00007654 [Hymenoscyphus fraxineus]CAG8978469.1 hypothetical protein HYALB_00005043 [Hymenoscyphus albidus]
MKFTIATLFVASVLGMAIAAPVKREEAALPVVPGAFEENKSIVLVRVKGDVVEESES